MGTKIQLHFGDTVISATLNDSTAAKEFLKRLPCTIHASRYDFDICGVLEKPLPRIKEEIVTGWHNGDISFDGTYFTILFGHGSMQILGRWTVQCPKWRNCMEAMIF